MIKEEYDPGTKIWTTVFGLFAMLFIQWVAVVAPRIAHPPRATSAGWNLVAILIGLVAPLAWLVADLKRYRIGLTWVLVMSLLTVWSVVSILLAG